MSAESTNVTVPIPVEVSQKYERNLKRYWRVQIKERLKEQGANTIKGKKEAVADPNRWFAQMP